MPLNPPQHTPEHTPEWAMTLLRTVLDHWLAASPDPNGLFHPALDRHWNRLDAPDRTLVSQCRVIYNFCSGYALFGDTCYADAAGNGLSALTAYFQIAPGRYRWSVSQDGTEADAKADSYGHAFCVLAQATAARVFASPALAAAALDTWRSLATIFTDGQGGLVWTTGPDLDQSSALRSQNPMMHAFEALMALHRVDDTGTALRDAARLLAFLGALPDFGGGALIEAYDADWEPQSVEDDGVVDLGHAFEWAYLLSDWHALTGVSAALRLGEKFLRTGLTWGLDDDGGVRASAAPGGRPVSAVKGHWQQCEAVRAISRYATRHGRTDLDDTLARMLAFFHGHFVDEEFGGVYVSPPGLGAPPSLDKGNAWKLDYHTVNMCLELIGAHPDPTLSRAG